MEVIYLSIFCVFTFFLINHAPIFSLPRTKIYTYLNIEGGQKTKFGWLCRKVQYLLTCIFCISFWITLIVDPIYCVIVPVIATIINYHFLNSFKNRL